MFYKSENEESTLFLLESIEFNFMFEALTFPLIYTRRDDAFANNHSAAQHQNDGT